MCFVMAKGLDEDILDGVVSVCETLFFVQPLYHLAIPTIPVTGRNFVEVSRLNLPSRSDIFLSAWTILWSTTPGRFLPTSLLTCPRCRVGFELLDCQDPDDVD